MFYSPRSNKKGLYTALLLIVISFIASSMSAQIQKVGGIINFAAICGLTLGLFITIRYAISRYAYEIGDESIIITKTVGSKKSTVASLLLMTGEGVVKKPQTKTEKAEFESRFGKTDNRMNFCSNMQPTEVYVYVTEFNGKKFEIYLEIDENFAGKLEAAVSAAKEKAKNEEFYEG